MISLPLKLLPTNFLSMSDYFVGLALKGLISNYKNGNTIHIQENIYIIHSQQKITCSKATKETQ